MPTYNYNGQTQDGRYVHGTMDAPDKNAVADALLKEHILLITCHDAAEASEAPPLPPAPPPEIQPPTLNPSPEANNSSDEGILGFVIDHSGGAVQTRRQALAILIVVILFVTITVGNAFWNLVPRSIDQEPLPPLPGNKLRI